MIHAFSRSLRAASFSTALAAAGLLAALSTVNAQTFTNPTAITIPNSSFALGPGTPYPSPILVSGLGSQLMSISVTLSGFTHAYSADVDVLLVGPQGQNVMLMSDVGSFNPANNLTFTFSNTAVTAMPSSSALTSGLFAPTNFDPVGDVDGFAAPAPLVGPYGTSFNPFIGLDPNGTWSLYVVDDVAGNMGQFAGGWSLTLSAVPEPSTYALFGFAIVAIALAVRFRLISVR